MRKLYGRSKWILGVAFMSVGSIASVESYASDWDILGLELGITVAEAKSQLEKIASESQDNSEFSVYSLEGYGQQSESSLAILFRSADGRNQPKPASNLVVYFPPPGTGDNAYMVYRRQSFNAFASSQNDPNIVPPPDVETVRGAIISRFGQPVQTFPASANKMEVFVWGEAPCEAFPAFMGGFERDYGKYAQIALNHIRNVYGRIPSLGTCGKSLIVVLEVETEQAAKRMGRNPVVREVVTMLIDFPEIVAAEQKFKSIAEAHEAAQNAEFNARSRQEVEF